MLRSPPRSIQDRLPTQDLGETPPSIPIPDEEIEIVYEIVEGKDIDVAENYEILAFSNNIPSKIGITLPDDPELDRIVEVADIIENEIRSSTLAGVDPTIDDAVDDLGSAISAGGLGEQDDEVREGVKILFSEAIEGVSILSQVILSGLKIADTGIGIGLIVITLSVLLALAAAIPTLGWSLGALPWLGLVAVKLGALATIVVAGGIATGGEYLSINDRIHAGGIDLLVNSEDYGEVI